MEEQLQMQHKEQKQGFLFLYAISQELKDKAKAEGFNVSDFIPRLSKFYQVRELKRDTIVDAFAVTNQFKYIIILAHHNNDDSLVLSDESHLQMSHLISLLPDDLQGSVLDFAICKSDSVADIIKAKTHCEHVLSTKGYTDLKPRFLIYLFLPGYMKAHPEMDDYLVAYSSCLSELKHKIGKKNSRHSTTKLGTMATGEQPIEVPRNSEFFIRVIFHDESSEETIDKNITKAYNIPHIFKDSILEELKDGDDVYVKLDFNSPYDLYDDEMTENLILGGGERLFPFDISKAKNKVTYRCYVKDSFRLNGFSGTVTIKIKDNPIPVDEWIFSIRVTPYIDEYTNVLSTNDLKDEYSDNQRLNSFPFGPRVDYAGTAGPFPIKTNGQEKTMNDEKEKEEPDFVKECFNKRCYLNDFSKDKVETVVKSYYNGINSNLAIIESALFDHDMLQKRNQHKSFIKSLIYWGAISDISETKEEKEAVIKKIANTMSYKMKRLPENGYQDEEWDKPYLVNEKAICKGIGKILGPSIPYCR